MNATQQIVAAEGSDTVSLYSELSTRYENCSLFAENCRKILEGLKSLEPVAHQYDLNEQHAANGFRSFLKLLHKFATLVMKQSDSNRKHDIDANFIQMSNVLLRALELIIKFRSEKLISESGHISGIEIITTAFHLEEELKAMNGKNRNFWLCASMRRALNHYINLIVMMSNPASSLFKMFNGEFKAKVFTDFSLNTSSNFVKKLWSLSEMSVYKTLLPLVLYKLKPRIVKTLFIPRKSILVIDGVTSELKLQNEQELSAGKSIRCRFLQEQQFGSSPNNSLVIHCHGAGFLCQSPDSHEVYLKDWASKLSGVPILSVDYSLSPESKYPTALQDVLDVYLFVTSKSEKVKQMIGFLPENIILCGDSAGGVLVIALTFVLNDARRLMEIMMPSNLIAFYPVGLLRINPSPSRMFILFDTFLTVGVILSIVDAYLRTVEYESDNQAKALEKDPSKSVWYRKDIFEKRLTEIDEIAKHPYVSPLLYTDYDSLKEIGLTIIVGEFDPFLDDCVEMARKWKGPVKFDVLQDLSHGFLYFRAVSKEARQACNLSLQRITESTQP
ncbi:hormone-sensitive lipase-like protein [Leptotrombidium deliense]|uniref:Hormone-sensitive lipase-like protein n=1 Tax=Leptotrombidium deliense TaxID=299467 RepID=A0A443S5R1_9ACAR|nr:hormone-sensitive lipase-like protein [Leptotrombidium deliense]